MSNTESQPVLPNNPVTPGTGSTGTSSLSYSVDSSFTYSFGPTNHGHYQSNSTNNNRVTGGSSFTYTFGSTNHHDRYQSNSADNNLVTPRTNTAIGIASSRSRGGSCSGNATTSRSTSRSVRPIGSFFTPTRTALASRQPNNDRQITTADVGEHEEVDRYAYSNIINQPLPLPNRFSVPEQQQQQQLPGYHPTPNQNNPHYHRNGYDVYGGYGAGYGGNNGYGAGYSGGYSDGYGQPGYLQTLNQHSHYYPQQQPPPPPPPTPLPLAVALGVAGTHDWIRKCALSELAINFFIAYRYDRGPLETVLQMKLNTLAQQYQHYRKVRYNKDTLKTNASSLISTWKRKIRNALSQQYQQEKAVADDTANVGEREVVDNELQPPPPPPPQRSLPPQPGESFDDWLHTEEEDGEEEEEEVGIIVTTRKRGKFDVTEVDDIVTSAVATSAVAASALAISAAAAAQKSPSNIEAQISKRPSLVALPRLMSSSSRSTTNSVPPAMTTVSTVVQKQNSSTPMNTATAPHLTKRPVIPVFKPTMTIAEMHATAEKFVTELSLNSTPSRDPADKAAAMAVAAAAAGEAYKRKMEEEDNAMADDAGGSFSPSTSTPTPKKMTTVSTVVQKQNSSTPIAAATSRRPKYSRPKYSLDRYRLNSSSIAADNTIEDLHRKINVCVPLFVDDDYENVEIIWSDDDHDDSDDNVHACSDFCLPLEIFPYGWICADDDSVTEKERMLLNKKLREQEERECDGSDDDDDDEDGMSVDDDDDDDDDVDVDGVDVDPMMNNDDDVNADLMMYNDDVDTDADSMMYNDNDDDVNVAIADVVPGSRIGVFWPPDGNYYPCIVKNKQGSKWNVIYDNGDKEWVDLSQCQLRREHSNPPIEADGTDDYGENNDNDDEISDSDWDGIVDDDNNSNEEQNNPGINVVYDTIIWTEKLAQDFPKIHTKLHKPKTGSKRFKYHVIQLHCARGMKFVHDVGWLDEYWIRFFETYYTDKVRCLEDITGEITILKRKEKKGRKVSRYKDGVHRSKNGYYNPSLKFRKIVKLSEENEIIVDFSIQIFFHSFDRFKQIYEIPVDQRNDRQKEWFDVVVTKGQMLPYTNLESSHLNSIKEDIARTNMTLEPKPINLSRREHCCRAGKCVGAGCDVTFINYRCNHNPNGHDSHCRRVYLFLCGKCDNDSNMTEQEKEKAVAYSYYIPPLSTKCGDSEDTTEEEKEDVSPLSTKYVDSMVEAVAEWKEQKLLPKSHRISCQKIVDRINKKNDTNIHERNVRKRVLRIFKNNVDDAEKIYENSVEYDEDENAMSEAVAEWKEQKLLPKGHRISCREIVDSINKKNDTNINVKNVRQRVLRFFKNNVDDTDDNDEDSVEYDEDDNAEDDSDSVEYDEDDNAEDDEDDNDSSISSAL